MLLMETEILILFNFYVLQIIFLYFFFPTILKIILAPRTVQK